MSDPLVKIETKYLRKKNRDLQEDNDRLELALKLVTGEDRQTLIEAIGYIKDTRWARKHNTTGMRVMSTPEYWAMSSNNPRKIT